MMDNQHTELSERLQAAKRHILADRKIWKRLRYAHALLKVGVIPSDKQAALLALDVIPYLDKQGVVLSDYSETMLEDFLIDLKATAWNEGDTLENFRVLKKAREDTR